MYCADSAIHEFMRNSLLYAAASAVGRAAYGQGSGDIVLDDVHCASSETSLVDCSHRGLGVDNCAHSEDAGVVCRRELSIKFVYSVLY